MRLLTVLAVLLTIAFLAPDARAPPGEVLLESPTAGIVLRPGDSIVVSGYVREFDGTPVGDAIVNASVARQDRTNVPGTLASTVTDPQTGFFVLMLVIPALLEQGSYLVRVSSPDPSVRSAEVPVTVRVPLNPTSGLPVWLWLVVIIVPAAAMTGAVTAYLRFRKG